MPLLKFTKNEASVHRAVVVSIDLGEFSDFCRGPDAVSVAAPKLIHRMFELLNESFSDSAPRAFRPNVPIQKPSLPGIPRLPGKFSPHDKNHPTKIQIPPPDFNKFTGDGALMIWTCPVKLNFEQQFCDNVVHTMRSFQSRLSSLIPKWETLERLSGFPKCLRVGIATGNVYGLRVPYDETQGSESPPPFDYVGYCINLAVRLQDHCPEVGFIIHKDLHPKIEGLQPYITVGLKGSESTQVLLFREDADRLSTTQQITKLQPAQVS